MSLRKGVLSEGLVWSHVPQIHGIARGASCNLHSALTVPVIFLCNFLIRRIPFCSCIEGRPLSFRLHPIAFVAVFSPFAQTHCTTIFVQTSSVHRLGSQSSPTIHLISLQNASLDCKLRHRTGSSRFCTGKLLRSIAPQLLIKEGCHHHRACCLRHFMSDGTGSRCHRHSLQRTGTGKHTLSVSGRKWQWRNGWNDERQHPHCHWPRSFRTHIHGRGSSCDSGCRCSSGLDCGLARAVGGTRPVIDSI